MEEEFAVIRRAFPATYGKVQDRRPARYLDQHQVESLLVACVDGTWQGSRDQLAIRLGLTDAVQAATPNEAPCLIGIEG